ncbi:MAG: hypothetical protein EOP93_06415 [Lysobacteraceae bacterium]|nr:MAG: hypothetical protein EOP93_06415 [Xanthomonadaceae bacterium]
MNESARYAMPVGNIEQDEIDLLECLLRINNGEALDPRAAEMCTRLLAAGLVDRSGHGLHLTGAGIARCQSLQHRITSDQEAAKVLAARGIALAMTGSAATQST